MALAPPRSAAFPIAVMSVTFGVSLTQVGTPPPAHCPRAGLDKRRVAADRGTVPLGMGAGEVQLEAGDLTGKPPGNHCKLLRCTAKDAGDDRFLCERREFVHEILRGVREPHRVQEPVLQYNEAGTRMAFFWDRPDRFRDNTAGSQSKHPRERGPGCPEYPCREEEVVVERYATNRYAAGPDRYHSSENGC